MEKQKELDKIYIKICREVRLNKFISYFFKYLGIFFMIYIVFVSVAVGIMNFTSEGNKIVINISGSFALSIGGVKMFIRFINPEKKALLHMKYATSVDKIKRKTYDTLNNSNMSIKKKEEKIKKYYSRVSSMGSNLFYKTLTQNDENNEKIEENVGGFTVEETDYSIPTPVFDDKKNENTTTDENYSIPTLVFDDDAL